MSWQDVLKSEDIIKIVYDLIEKEGYVFKETIEGWNHLDVFMKGDAELIVGDIKSYGVNGAWYDKQRETIRYMSLDGTNTMLRAKGEIEVIASIWNQMKNHGSPTNKKYDGNTIYQFGRGYDILVNETDDFPEFRE